MIHRLPPWPTLVPFAFAVLLSAAPAAESARGDTVAERMARQRALYRQSGDKLAIGPVTVGAAAVPVFGRLEARFTLTAAYANPFDSAEIQVDGVITRPDGRTVVVPAFYHVPFEPERGLTQLGQTVPYRAAGAPGWRLRFAPDTAGEYRLVIRAREAGGRQAESPPQPFRAEPSSRKGFVQVSAANPMFFEHSGDGSLFWPVGANVAYTRGDEPRKGAKGPPTYEHYFSRAAGKINATRVWLCHWAWLEWTPQQANHHWAEYAGAGYYNQQIAAALDRVFALAEAQGLRVMLVTEDNNEFSKTESAAGSWAAHPYQRANGGPCAEPADFFTAAEARRLYRNRLRYIAARWGYSDSLWALNSMNDHSNPTAEQVGWVREMHGYVHRLFDGYRPIVYGTNFRFAADEISDYRQAGHGAIGRDKPNVVQECYYTRDPTAFRPELREQLWNGLRRGLGGVMVWDHVLVDRTEAWDEFRPLMRFVEDLPLHRHSWQPLRARVVAAQASKPGPYHRAVVLRSYGDVPDYGVKSPRSRFDVDLTQSRQWLEGYSRTLFSAGSKGAWRNPPVFALTMPTTGKLWIELSEFSGRMSTLLVSQRGADGDAWRETATVRLENGRRLVTASEKWVSVSLPAGPQQVMLDARGDWIRAERLAIALPVEDAAGLIEVGGWTDGREAFLLLQNQSQSRLLAEIAAQPPVGLRHVRVDLEGLPDGDYRIESYDTRTGDAVGAATESAAAGRLIVTVPVLAADAALKIRRQ